MVSKQLAQFLKILQLTLIPGRIHSYSYRALTSFIIRDLSPGGVDPEISDPSLCPCFLSASLWLRASWKGQGSKWGVLAAPLNGHRCSEERSVSWGIRHQVLIGGKQGSGCQGDLVSGHQIMRFEGRQVDSCQVLIACAGLSSFSGAWGGRS